MDFNTQSGRDCLPLHKFSRGQRVWRRRKNIYYAVRLSSAIILLGVGGTIYKTRTLKPFEELGLDSQRVKELASKLHVHSVNFAANLVHT
jgi:hypothetical protein